MTMSLFLTIFLTLYTGLHYYLYGKIVGALAPGAPGKALLGVIFIFMIIAPVLVRLAERHELDLLARLLAYTGYIWMGVAFLCFSLSFLVDLYRLLLWGLSPWLDLSALRPSRRTAFFLPGLLSILIGFYGFYAALQIKTETHTLVTEKLPAGVDRLRIAFISDLHLGVIVGEDRVKRVLRVLEEAKPDLLISLGDLVDGQLNHVEGSMALLAKYQPPLGKYAVPGNHEYFVGLPYALALTQEAGFTLLRGEAVTVGGLVNLAGADDPTAQRFGLALPGEEKTLLAGLPRDRFTLLLKHQPLVEEDSLGLFDLQVSGHTHRGQIFPFYLLTRLVFPYPTGFARLSKGSSLYTSRGTGTWGPPIRFLAPPEVTVLDLVRP
ncbi:MAG: metallophosphoesterase [Smithellaceae bacterium]|nr:metallophosphoesterase [Smithellaceae bacterium]